MHGGGGPAAQDAQAAGGGAPPGDQAELSEEAHTASWRGEEKGRGINRGEKRKKGKKKKQVSESRLAVRCQGLPMWWPETKSGIAHFP